MTEKAQPLNCIECQSNRTTQRGRSLECHACGIVYFISAAELAAQAKAKAS